MPVLLWVVVVSVVIHADPAPSVLVLVILHTDIFVATPSVLVLIPVELEKKPVLLRPMVVVAPAFSVVIHADPAPSVLVLIVPVLEKVPVLLCVVVVSVVIHADPAPSVLVLVILQTDIFVATPSVFVLIPVELEKKPVLLRPIVVVAPAFSDVIHADPAPSILVLRILHTDIFVATPRLLVLILPPLEK